MDQAEDYSILLSVCITYGTCCAAILISILSFQVYEDTAQGEGQLESSRILAEDDKQAQSESESESDRSKMELMELQKHNLQVTTPENELRLFKEIWAFVKLDLLQLAELISMFAVLCAVVFYIYLNLLYIVALVIGLAEFFCSYWFLRMSLIKTSFHLDFTSYKKKVCSKNWRQILRYVFSSIMFCTGITVVSLYSLYLCYTYLTKIKYFEQTQTPRA